MALTRSVTADGAYLKNMQIGGYNAPDLAIVSLLSSTPSNNPNISALYQAYLSVLLVAVLQRFFLAYYAAIFDPFIGVLCSDHCTLGTRDQF